MSCLRGKSHFQPCIHSDPDENRVLQDSENPLLLAVKSRLKRDEYDQY